MIGAVGVAVLVAALVLRIPALVTPGLALLGAEYAGLFVVRGDTLDVRAPLYGAAFLVVAELSFAALELRAGRPEPGLVPRRAAVLVGAAAAGVIVGLVVLAAAATPLNGGLGLEAAGIVAAVRPRRCARPRGGAVAMTVAVVGSLSLDFVDGGAPRVGGAPFYAARALRALGAPAVIAAKCAAPDRQLLLPPLIRLGLPCAGRTRPCRPPSRSPTSASSGACRSRRSPIRGLRRRQWRRSATRAGCRLRRSAARTSRPRRWRHSPAAAASCSTARASPVRPGSAHSSSMPTTTRPYCGPCRCSSSRRTRPSCWSTATTSERWAAWASSEVVVTLGSRGCIVFADGVAELVRAHPVAAADPTGAGDAFAAAYVVARSGGAAPTAAARRAAALVSDLLAGRAA